MSTLTTQSRHPDPRAAQSSQSITTGARPGGCAAASVWSAACHGVVPLGLAHEVVRTLIASTDIRCRRVRARRRERLRVSAGA